MPTPKPPPASKPPRHERAGRPPPSGHTEALRATLREWRTKKGMRQEDVANRLREDFGIEVAPDRAEAAKLVDLVSPPKLRDVERILERLLDMSPSEVAKLAKYLANE